MNKGTGRRQAEFLSRETPLSKVLGQEIILNFEGTQEGHRAERTRGKMAGEDVERENWACF